MQEISLRQMFKLFGGVVFLLFFLPLQHFPLTLMDFFLHCLLAELPPRSVT